MLNPFSNRAFSIILLLVFISFFSFSPLSAYERRRAHLQIKKSGDAGQYAVPLAAALISLAHRDYEGMKFYAGSFSATMGAAYAIKPLINAKRPISGRMSFPSGHTAAAMGAAAYMQMRYGMAYGIPCYVLASYVGFSRVYAQKHWFRDVLGATAIAMAANAFFTKPFSENYQLIPQLERDRAGICVRWEW